MKNSCELSIVIPMFNEALNIIPVISDMVAELRKQGIKFEILAIDDLSTDDTAEVAQTLANEFSEVNLIINQFTKGYAGAIKTGVTNVSGEFFIVVTGDGADFPCDVVNFYRTCREEELDFVFGSRFQAGGKVFDYPKLKYLVNRVGNRLMQLTFLSRCDDLSNSFKMYRSSFVKSNIELTSGGFEITIELALKALNLSRNYVVIPNMWKNRAEGYSKMSMFKVIPRFFKTYVGLLNKRYFSEGHK